jgi:hypothetical protein
MQHPLPCTPVPLNKRRLPDYTIHGRSTQTSSRVVSIAEPLIDSSRRGKASGIRCNDMSLAAEKTCEILCRDQHQLPNLPFQDCQSVALSSIGRTNLRQCNAILPGLFTPASPVRCRLARLSTSRSTSDWLENYPQCSTVQESCSIRYTGVLRYGLRARGGLCSRTDLPVTWPTRNCHFDPNYIHKQGTTVQPPNTSLLKEIPTPWPYLLLRLI